MMPVLLRSRDTLGQPNDALTHHEWTTMETVRLRATARGDVQGVGFRAFTRRYARTLGVVGYARNLADGSVEVVAEGPHAAMGSFLGVVKRGSPSGHIDSVAIQWETPTGEFTTFTIR